MHCFRRVLAIFFLVLGVAITSSNTQAAIDPVAAAVSLRKSCNDGAGNTLNNCFSTMASLRDWIVTRQPSTAKPLIVDIGPGVFPGPFNCINVSGITLRGSGVGQTVIDGGASNYGIQGNNCHQFQAQDMTVKSVFTPVVWFNDGSSNWNNVNIEGLSYGWSENCANATTRPVHIWRASILKSQGKTYESHCSESWFFGSQIVAKGAGFGGLLNAFEALDNPSPPFRSEIHVYGGNVRAIAVSGAQYLNNSLHAVRAVNADVHLHGAGIDVISTDNYNVVALGASNGATIHASGVGYVLETGAGGMAMRINNVGGHVHAPYFWEHIPNTDGNSNTIDTNFVSANGADQTTVTGGTSDGHPHPVVYSVTCPPNARWYDIIDKVCRSQ